MIPLEDLKAFIKDWGIKIDDDTLECIVEMVNEAFDCLVEQGLSVCVIKLALKSAAGLHVLGFGMRIVNSLGLKGLTKGWKVQDIQDQYKMLQSNLYTYDKTGCTNSVIPTNPFNQTFFGVVDGSSC